MYVKQLAALTEYLAGARREVDEICRYLVLNTFQNLNPRSIYLGEIESNGTLNMRSSFGFEPLQIVRWAKIPLSANIPITESINSNICIVVASESEYFKKYPEVEKLGEVDINWSNAVAVPILPFGAFFLALNGQPDRDGGFEPFLRCIGHLLALSLRQSAEKGISADDQSTRKKSSPKELTSRQEVIVELLSKGFTNNEISKEIGYSESLIRQETVTIYAFMGVSGRKELIRMVDAQSVKA